MCKEEDCHRVCRQTHGNDEGKSELGTKHESCTDYAEGYSNIWGKETTIMAPQDEEDDYTEANVELTSCFAETLNK